MGAVHSCDQNKKAKAAQIAKRNAAAANSTIERKASRIREALRNGNGLLCLPSFTEQQKSLIRSTWAEVQCERRAKLHNVGVDTFGNFFDHSPGFKSAFANLKNLNAQELRDSPHLKAHAMAVLHVVEQLVNHVDNIDNWVEIIASLASRHWNLSITPELAQDVASQSWVAIRQILLDRKKLSDEVEIAWLMLTKWLGAAMETGLNVVRQT